MSIQPVNTPPPPTISIDVSSSGTSSAWDRFTAWASDNKVVVYTVGAVVIVATGAGAAYYLSDSNTSRPDGQSGSPGEKKKSKKERREAKKAAEEARKLEEAKSKAPTVEPEDELPEVDASIVESLSPEVRKEYAARLKKAGNDQYGSKNFNKAIELYSKAILCKPDPIFYSNRAACYNALGDWNKTIEDTTAAISLDSGYLKALNRRANAYEHIGNYSEALIDTTAGCILTDFTNQKSAQSVERLLKAVAEAKAKTIMTTKEKKLPSATFVTNYLQSFRPKPPPPDLAESVELGEETGKGQLQRGLAALQGRTGDSYNEASNSFDKALELGDLGDDEALAYNMRGTFRYLRGENTDALSDLTKSVELQPSLTQSYIKRASMHLELGNREAAADDFEQAMSQNKEDPDIYYHRGQLHFITSEFAEAAKDYQKSIDLDKDFIFSYIQLGVTQYKMGSVASSMATFRRCIKAFDKVPDVYNYYGELLLDQQKYEEAIAKFDTAVEMEQKTKPIGMNVLPLINKALALFQWKNDFKEAEKLCQKALIIDPECDIAVATMAQLLLQQTRVTEALKYFERAAELARTEGEIVSAISYAEATRTQLEVQERYPALAEKLGNLAGGQPSGMTGTVSA